MTLTTRLLVFFLSTLALVLAGFSTSLYLSADSFLRRQVEERLDTVLNTISGAVEDGQFGVEWEPANRQLKLDFALLGDQVVWFVADDHGRVVDQSKSGNADDFLADTSPSLQLKPAESGAVQWTGSSWVAGEQSIHSVLRKTDQATLARPRPKNKDYYPAMSVTAGVSLTPMRTALRELAISLAGFSVGIWLVSLAIGRFVCRLALLPVSRMAIAAGEIDASDLAERLPPVATKDELEDLNRAFNSLLDRLNEAFERQRRFTGDASHQLRTPLTAILGQIEVILRRDRSAAEYRAALETVQQSAGHLARMVESLLFLARADSEAQFPALAPLDLAEWLPRHLSTWSEHPRAPDMAFATTATEACRIDAQSALLGELLNLLLDNACKYSEPGTPITLRLECLATGVCVKVEDRGWGIAENDLANLFVPFCRSDETRRRGIEGVGLGLSIARRLAEVFHGSLTVASRPGDGSSFILQFPFAGSTATATHTTGARSDFNPQGPAADLR